MRKFIVSIYVIVFISTGLKAENGYDLWLKYRPIDNISLKNDYSGILQSIYISGNSQTVGLIKEELSRASKGMVGLTPIFSTQILSGLNLVLTKDEKALKNYKQNISPLNDEGFILNNEGGKVFIIAKTDIGLLYGMFHLLRFMGMNTPVNRFNAIEEPKIKLRMLNHWDNLTRTVERGYAGQSIWNWHT
jgi:alpha-glucuronidase